MARVTKRGYPTMTTSAEHPAQPKADSEPPSDGTVKIEREIGHVVMWVWARWAVVTVALGLLTTAVAWGFSKVTDAIDRRVEPLKAAIDPIKNAVEKAADHDARIKIVEARIGDIHSDVRDIKRILLNGSHAKKSEP